MNKLVHFIQFIFRILALFCYMSIIALLCITAPYLVGLHPTVILSGSMEPAIMTGDLVYISQVKTIGALKTGDIISFQKEENETPVTHRIVGLDESRQSIQTKGDANDSIDSPEITFNQVNGKVSDFHIPAAGYALQYVKQPIIIGLAAFILVMDFILGSLSSKDKKSKN